jgi:hypothetical protein
MGGVVDAVDSLAYPGGRRVGANKRSLPTTVDHQPICYGRAFR